MQPTRWRRQERKALTASSDQLVVAIATHPDRLAGCVAMATADPAAWMDLGKGLKEFMMGKGQRFV